MSLGVKAAGLSVDAAFDSWEEAVSIYNHNQEGNPAHVADICSSDGRRVVQNVSKKLGEVEILVGGPPCKGVSRLRNGNHDEKHNNVVAERAVVPLNVEAPSGHT